MKNADAPKVLLLDNDGEFASWADDLLGLCGVNSCAAATEDEAEKLLSAGGISCAILSADMGPAILKLGSRLARHQEKPVPVAFVTAGEADEAAMLEAHYYHGMYLMHKPVSPSQLLAWVGSLLIVSERITGYQQLVAMLEQQASTDPLTGLFNRRLFFRRFEEELARASRTGDHTGLVYLDVDHFKKINDTYGHNAGDAVLRQVAEIIEQTLRKSDVVGRIGGEEFVVLLPNTGEEQALMIGGRLRRKVEARKFTAGDVELNATVSAGVCTCINARGVRPETMIEAADKALYEAKQGGRNRVVLCSAGAEQGS